MWSSWRSLILTADSSSVVPETLKSERRHKASLLATRRVHGRRPPWPRRQRSSHGLSEPSWRWTVSDPPLPLPPPLCMCCPACLPPDEAEPDVSSPFQCWPSRGSTVSSETSAASTWTLCPWKLLRTCWTLNSAWNTVHPCIIKVLFYSRVLTWRILKRYITLHNLFKHENTGQFIRDNTCLQVNTLKGACCKVRDYMNV